MSILFRSDVSDMMDTIETLFNISFEKPKQKRATEVNLELPGVEQKCIRTHLKDETLVVQWLDRHQVERRKEYYVGDVDEVDATYKDGLLSMRVVRKKKEKDNGVEIKIKGA